MKGKICHLTSAHRYTDGRIFYKECCSLAKEGYTVYLIAPNAPNKIECEVQIVGIDVNNKSRWFRMFILPKLIYKKARLIDADVYHFHDPELLPLGLKLKRKGKKVIFDSHEDVPVFIRHKKYIWSLFRLIIAKLYNFYEAYVVHRLDAVISVTPQIVDRLRKININTYQITNYPIVSSNDNLNVSCDRNIVFAGGVSPLWMHENIICSIKDIDINYVIAGKSSDDYLKILQKLEGWNKVKYLGFISNSEVKTIYRTAIAGVAILGYSPIVGGKLGTLGNTKLFEIMEMGLPVVCTDFSLWKKIIDKWKCGVYVNPYNIEEKKQAILYLLDNPEIACEMGRNGRKAVLKEYNWMSQEQILYRLYSNLMPII